MTLAIAPIILQQPVAMIKLWTYMMLDSIESILISSAQLRYKPIEVESSLFRHQHSPELMDSIQKNFTF
jgi:hypothetical protein